jgi:PKD repeat protein
MKKFTLIISGLLLVGSLFAQQAKEDDKVVVIPCTEFHITRPLSELVKENPVDENKLYEKHESEDRENRKPQKFRKSVKDGPEYGNDPSTLQKEMGTVPGKAPIMNWAGQTASSFRPFDPSGAAGPTHYVQMINSTTFKVYNKSTGAAMLTATLGNLWSPATVNDGDPIVMYDKAANRWFLAQFGQTGNKMYIAISTTGDPTGSYYTYTFSSPDFPDYLKFSVWQDGYYMTGNYAQKVFCFERTAMLAGTPGARSIYKTFSPPNAGYFFVPLTGDAEDGVLPAAGTPCPIFSYSDNGWGAGYTDAINIFQMAVNWAATPTATISSAGSVPTGAFDATYDPSWNDVSQPGTTQKLDGIGGVLMYRAQWKTWSGYNTIVLNWAVKISSTQRSIKWCELRQNQSTGVWSMYQEGIYTPDASTRWLGSIAMDNNGSIALAYMKANSSSTIYPGLYYTGRRTCDPLGTLPVTETVAIAGTGSQTGINRDGDYAQMVLDPDGVTFWYTGEYMGGTTGGSAAKTRVFSFQITPCASAPPVANFSATPTTLCAGQSVAFTDLSTNTPTSWAWTFTGGTPSSSIVQNPTVVYSTPGTYSVTLTATNASGSNTVTQTNYIVVKAVPATPTASSNSPVCVGSTINLSTAAVTSATYAWTGPSSFTSAVQNPTRPSATTAMAGTYSVTVTVNGCTSIAGTTAVVVNTIPATPTVTSNTPVCAGSTINLTASTISGATYSWTGPSTFTSTTQNPTRPSATTAMAGTYSVTATVNGCTSVAGTTSVVVNSLPATPTATATSPVCAGSTISLSTPAVTGATYAWTGPGGFTSTSQNPTRPGATLTMAGTYSVTVTVSGCTSLAGTATVVVNSSPTITVNSAAICAGQSASLTANGGTTYSWNTGSTSNPLTVTPTTTTSYTVTGTNSGCSGTAVSTVTVTPNPVITVNNQTICSGQSATLTATGGTTYLWNTGSTSNPLTVTPVSTTTYTVTGTTSSCSGSATATVTVNPIPTTPTATATSPVCAGSTISLSTPTVAGATYVWTGPSTFTSTTQNPSRPGATTAMAGTYSVTVTVGGCTSAAGTANVIVNAIPSAPTVTSNSPVCAGSTINLTASTIAGATYSWTGPSTFTSTTQNPTRPSATTAMAGTYSVTATVSGCTSVAGTASVVVNSIPTSPTATATSPVCAGSTISFTTPTVAGATYAWTGPSTFTSTAQNPTRPGATTAMAGTYSVTVTVGGCTSAAGTANVVVNAIPSAPTVTTNSPVCAGSTINLTASTIAGATYVWTGPSTFTSTTQNPTRPSATTAMAGTYSVTATVSGCTSIAGTANVVVNPIPTTPTATATSPVCSGSTISLSTPTVAGATYAWTGPSTFTSTTQNPTRPGATTAMAGTYSVTVTVGGCTSAAGTANVVVNTTPAAPTATSNSPVCSGTTISLTSNTIAGATYSWTGPSTFTSTTQNPTRPGATTAMAGTYSVTATVSGCTSAAGTANVIVNAGPTAQATSTTNTACGSSTGTITIGATTGGTSPYTYSVNGSGFTTTTSYSGLAAGSYPVIVKDANGCTFSTTASISNSSGPTAQAVTTVNSICGNSNGGISIGATTGGTGPYTYSVNGSAFTTNTSYTGLAAGTYSIIVKDAGGCMFTTSATISNTAGPVAATTSSNSTCGNSNGSAGVGVAGGTPSYSYLWSPSGATTAIITNVTAGTYTVTVTDQNGCIATSTATVANTPGPTAASVNTGNSTCEGTDGTINIGAITGGTVPYSYSVNGSGFTTTTSYSGLAAGSYPVIVKDANGCTFTTSATIGNTGTIPATPTITQSGLILTSSSATGNQWYLNGSIIPGATGQNYTVTANGNYTVVVTTGGCSSAASAVTVVTGVGIGEITNNPYGLSVYPNPNDGHFTISFESTNRSDYRVEIVNAIGQLVFRDDIKDFTGPYKKEMSVVEYGQGVYTISLTNSKNETVKKIVVY